MQLYPVILTIMIVAGVLYYTYLSVDWDWLNPYNVKKGLVLGSALRHEAWKERDKAQATARAETAEEEFRKVDAERESLNARIQELYESVNKPEPIEVKGTFFRGSDATTKRDRVAPLSLDEENLGDGILGTISGGAQPAPPGWDRLKRQRVNTRRPGAFIKRQNETS